MKIYGAPRLLALDEDGRFLEPWDGQNLAGPRSSTWTWHPGVPGVLDLTPPQWPHRLVLLDVDTLQVQRIDSPELDGKWGVPYRPGELRAHLEGRLEDLRAVRARYDSEVVARAMRRLATTGCPSSWGRRHPVVARVHPEHPLEARHWLRRRVA